jgi:hypothetical protein
MSKDVTMDEGGKYKDSSKNKIKLMIMFYRCLRFLNGDFFYFIFSLATILVPLFIFNFSVGVIVFGMILHYLIFMTLIKSRIDKVFNTKKEIREIDQVIEELRSYLNDKNPNV